MKCTIKVDAAMANVPLGTMDRVIDERGGVSEKAKMRIEEWLQSIECIRMGTIPGVYYQKS